MFINIKISADLDTCYCLYRTITTYCYDFWYINI